MKSEQRRISVSPAQFKVRETNISTGPHDGGRSVSIHVRFRPNLVAEFVKILYVGKFVKIQALPRIP